MSLTRPARVKISAFLCPMAACLVSNAQEFQRPMDSVITNKPVMTIAEFENVAQDRGMQAGLEQPLVGSLLNEVRDRYDGRILTPPEQALALLTILYADGVPYETARQFLAGMQTGVPCPVDVGFLDRVRTARVTGRTVAHIRELGGQLPIPIDQPLPGYTEAARRYHVEGIILLSGIVLEDGSVANLRCLRTLGYGLDEAALLKVQNNWKFEPARLEGRPVPVKAEIEVALRLY
jgi:TonB family protein